MKKLVLIPRWDFEELSQFGSFNVYDIVKHFERLEELPLNKTYLESIKNQYDYAVIYNGTKYSHFEELLDIFDNVEIFTSLDMTLATTSLLARHEHIKKIFAYTFGPSAYGGPDSDGWKKRVRNAERLQLRIYHLYYMVDFKYLMSFEEDLEHLKKINLYLKDAFTTKAILNFSINTANNFIRNATEEEKEQWRYITGTKYLDYIIKGVPNFKAHIEKVDFDFIGPRSYVARKHILDYFEECFDNCPYNFLSNPRICYNCYINGTKHLQEYAQTIESLRQL